MKNARKFSWDEYFDNQLQYNTAENGTALFDNTSINNYYIFNCYFEECNENGAIFIKSANQICTLIEDSAFNNCSSTTYGGSVYYECEREGQFVQQRTCYTKSVARNRMSFHQSVKPSSSYKNYVIDVSVSKCGENESERWGTLNIAYGVICFSKNNVTNNKCFDYSSLDVYLDGSLSNCNFSTFRGNIQIFGTGSLYFFTRDESKYQTVSYCKIIGNQCGSNGGGVLFSSSCTTNVDHCIFLNNIAKYMFMQYWLNLTISDSYIQSNSTYPTGGTVTFKNLKENCDFYNYSYFNIEIDFLESEKIISYKLSYLFQFTKSAAPQLLSLNK